MTSIAIIPARGGSTRIPGKNWKEFHGRPIIEYSIETAQKSGLFDQIVVTTDHRSIAEVAEKLNAMVIWRPLSLAFNHIGTQEVASFTLNQFKDWPQYACCIYPTAPLMEAADLQKGFALLRNNEGLHDFAMAVGTEPLRDAGCFYWGTAVAWKENRSLIGPRTIMVPIPENRVCDINTPEDWQCALGKYEMNYLGKQA